MNKFFKWVKGLFGKKLENIDQLIYPELAKCNITDKFKGKFKSKPIKRKKIWLPNEENSTKIFGESGLRKALNETTKEERKEIYKTVKEGKTQKGDYLTSQKMTPEEQAQWIEDNLMGKKDK